MLVAVAGGTGPDVLFSVLVGLHVLAALTGFGSVGLAGIYGARAARFRPDQPAQDTEELLRYFAKPLRLWWTMVTVPFLGLSALATSPSGGGLGQAWVFAAVSVWLVAIVIARAFVKPSVERVRSMLHEAAMTGRPGDLWPLSSYEARLLARAGTVANQGAAVCDVLFVAALALMIWRP